MKGKETGGYPYRGYPLTAKARPQHWELHAQLLRNRKSQSQISTYVAGMEDSIAGMEQVKQR